jgi:hypothetical protein
MSSCLRHTSRLIQDHSTIWLTLSFSYFCCTIVVFVSVGRVFCFCILSIIQRSQSKILRMIVDSPWYVSNATLHADLSISYVQDVINQKCHNHHTRLETHENPPLKKLLSREENRRLKINWPIDLIWGTGESPLDDSPSRQCNNHNISL